jgi:hypothetical protein
MSGAERDGLKAPGAIHFGEDGGVQAQVGGQFGDGVTGRGRGDESGA